MKQTPVAQSSPMLPNTIACTFTAVPQLAGNVVQAAVGVGARVHPAAEHRADRAPQLLLRVLRKRLAGLLLDHVLVAVDHALPVLGGQRGVLDHAGVELDVLDDLLEPVMIDAEHDASRTSG